MKIKTILRCHSPHTMSPVVLEASPNKEEQESKASKIQCISAIRKAGHFIKKQIFIYVQVADINLKINRRKF